MTMPCRRRRQPALLMHYLLSILLTSSFISYSNAITRTPLFVSSVGGNHRKSFSLNFSSYYAKIPSSPTDRDKAAISSIQEAIQSPRTPNYPYVECEFPVLSSLNKLGDGSLRSSLEIEDANVEFVVKLANSWQQQNPMTAFFSWGRGKKVYVILSTSASNSLMNKVQTKVKKSVGATTTTVIDLRVGLPKDIIAGDSSRNGNTNSCVCVFLTPSSQRDYQTARVLAEAGIPTVVVNASFKDQKSIPPNATMAYFLKPLTYNSQVAGYLIRAYPSLWTVLENNSQGKAAAAAVLGAFTDEQILVDRTNTPDLRESGRLVQKSVDERAIRARRG